MTSERIIRALKYLEAAGLTQKQLSQLHHFSRNGKPMTFAVMYKYFGESKQLQENNTKLGERLEYLVELHRQSQMPALVKKTLQAKPL